MQQGVKPGFGLFEYQETGARWLAAGGRYLADEPRVGKTATLIRAADLVAAEQVVITCPASAVGVWEEAVPRWSAGLWDYRIGSYDRHTDHGLPAGDTYIFDEAHRLKSFQAARTRVLLGRSSPARLGKHVWAGSGTPMPNNVAELVPWLSFWGLWTEGYLAFVKRFCHYRLGDHDTVKVIGIRRDRAEELKALWRPVHLRRLRRDVLPSQDEALRDTIHLRADSVESDDQLYSIQIAPGELPNEDDEHFATVCRLVGEAKARALAPFLAEELTDAPGKVAVYYWHQSVGDILETALRPFGVVRVDGRTPAGEARSAKARQFSTDPGTRGFLGQIMAAGEAIDLAAQCSNLVMAERSWTHGQNEQAEARLSGPLQTERVLIRTAVLRGTLDEGQTHVLARKARNISQLH